MFTSTELYPYPRGKQMLFSSTNLCFSYCSIWYELSICCLSILSFLDNTNNFYSKTYCYIYQLTSQRMTNTSCFPCCFEFKYTILSIEVIPVHNGSHPFSVVFQENQFSGFVWSQFYGHFSTKIKQLKEYNISNFLVY